MEESREDRKNINKKLEKLVLMLDSFMQKPVKRYDTVVKSIFTAVVGALIGFLLSGVIPM